MKKFVKKLGALALAAGLVFGASFPTAQAAKEFEGQKVKVGVVGEADKELWQAVAEKAKKDEGIEIERSERNSLGSSDVGNVSQVVPTIQPTVSISDRPIPGHSEEFKAAAGSPKGYASIAVAATLLANTALALLLDPEKLAAIKAQHQSLTQTNNN